MRRRVIVELRHSKAVAGAAFEAMVGPEEELKIDLSPAPKLETCQLDEAFPLVQMPALVPRDQKDDPYDTADLLAISDDDEAATYVFRGEVEDDALEDFEQECKKNKAVTGVYSDVAIAPMIVCPGSPPVGTDADVERLLCASAMRRCRMDGTGVLVAVVDTGVNMAYLNSHGKNPNFDAGRSWAWRPGLTPGSMPVDHGTMVAYDVCIAAPKCTILDIALLHPISVGPGSTVMEALLSDAIRAYSHLINVMSVLRRPGDNSSLVVNNSWGMFHPSWDYPLGHPGNYSDNPNHPFNKIVATLERKGADILFAAGNCGKDCPDGRCQNVTDRTIYGANSHSAVLCVAGVDTRKQRVGYSAIGPGRLERKKPDVAGYTHFAGSGVYSSDGGTSAACPVVSGVVAAVRSKHPYNPSQTNTHPAAIRDLLRKTAEDRGPTGYDFEYGYGIVRGCALQKRLCKPPVIDFCRRYPWICYRYWWLCRRYPWLCRRLPRIPSGTPTASPPMGDMEAPFGNVLEAPFEVMADEADPIEALSADIEADAELSDEKLAYYMGYLEGLHRAAGEGGTPEEEEGCTCTEDTD
jgi:hypothetical protein